MAQITCQACRFNSMRHNDMGPLRKCYNLCTRHEVVEPLVMGQHEHLVLGGDLGYGHRQYCTRIHQQFKSP